MYNKAEEVVAVWVYLPQFDAHDHPQLSIWYQGADWGLTGKLNNLDLQRGKDILKLAKR